MHKVYSIESQPQRRKVWIKLVDSWYASDLTAKEFSEREQIKYTDLKRWSYRLGKKIKLSTAVTKSSSLQPPFIPITISPSLPSSSASSYLELKIANHYSIRFCNDTDDSLFIRLIHLLKGIDQ